MVDAGLDIFVDIQGFKCSFGYILKELAIYDGVRMSNFLFKPPFNRNMLSDKDKKVVSWAEGYHGMEWDSGNIDLNEINGILKILESSPTIYVKGYEKAKVLEKFLDQEKIYNIPIDFEPKLSKFKKIPECFFHKNVTLYHCALSNVKLLYDYKNCY